MSPQRGVAAADDQVIPAGFLRHLVHPLPDLPVRPCGLLHREAAGVGEDEKQLVLLGKAFPYALHAPVRVDRYPVNRLHAGGVIVQNDNFSPAPRRLLSKKGVRLLPVNL